MTPMPTLSDAQYCTLRLALGVAGEKYRDNAQALREMAPVYAEAERVGKVPVLTEQGAQLLAEQFDQQAADAFALIDTFDDYQEALSDAD